MTAPSVGPMSRTEWLIVGGLLTVFVILAGGSSQRVTHTFDEGAHYSYGRQILALNASRGSDNSKMPFSILNVLPGKVAGWIWPHTWGRRRESITLGRFATVACGVLLGWLVFRWSRALYGPAAGLLSLTLYVFEPNILAHAGLVTTDLYAAWMMTVAVWSFWRFLNYVGPHVWRMATLSALLVGLAQHAKFSAMFLVIILPLIALGHAAPDLWALLRAGQLRVVGRRLGRAVQFTALYVVVGLLVVNVGYLGLGTFKPFRDHIFQSNALRMAQDGLGPLAGVGLPVPAPFIEGLDRVLANERTGYDVYLLGQLGRNGVAGQRFPEYFWIAWLYKLPIGTQVLVLLALVAYLLGFRQFDFRRNEWPIACTVLFFAWYLTFIYNFQIGLRHALMVHPFVLVFAGSLLYARREVYGAARVALAAVLIWVAVSVVSYYPHFLAYFNEFIGNRKNGYRVLVDSNLDWGQTERAKRRYLARHPEVYEDVYGPQAGRLLVAANLYTGYIGRERFRWLRENFTPVGHVGYAYLLFDVSPEALRRVTDPVSPDHADKVN
jgi:Dolichyl-phosphate-mannose-protein mannosyltransferase